MSVGLQATSRYALTSNHEACARRDQASSELHTAELALLLKAVLQQRTRLVERQPRQSRKQLARIAVPQVAEEIRLDVPFRKKFLITAKTGLAGREELLVHLCVIETGHRSAIEPDRSGRQDQVRALQARIPLRGRFDQLRVP